MSLHLCELCESRYAILKFTTKKKQNLSICLRCYKDKVKTGEFPTISELGVEYYKQVIGSIPPENPTEVKGVRKMSQTGSKKSVATPTLDSLAKDLTEMASEGNLDPVLARNNEIERTIRILSRRSKNNPVLVGEPGVGKTAIVEGLAQRIIDGDVPDSLLNKKLYVLNMGNVVAGTKYRGEFEDRMKKMIDEMKSAGNIILFIDEIHTMVGAGGAEGAVDASNLLKPSLSRGELQLIGATTLEEYTKYIEKDSALERRFQKVDVGEPTLENAKMILVGLKKKYEEFHNINIEDDAVFAAVELSEKYINDRFLPDKAIDVLDEACAAKKLSISAKPQNIEELEKELEEVMKLKDEKIIENDFDEVKAAKKKEDALRKKMKKIQEQEEKKMEEQRTVTREDIAKVVGEWTGIPVNRISQGEKEKLKTLAEDLKASVKGQNEAIEIIAKSIRRNKLGLKDPKRPAGVFLLLGPTGVGKTELAKSIANLIYGSEDNMIRFDMSEYMEKHSASKLIGSPPGYVGYDEGGKLTKLLRRKPYSIVLFDEIEKAHPDIFNLLLQLFEEGRITDAKGRVIDGKNAIFLMTSNAGSEVYSANKTTLGFGQVDENKSLQEKVTEILKKKFAPEFLNRLDDTLIFNKLPETVMEEIAEKMVNESVSQMEAQNIKVTFTKEVIKYLAKKGFDPQYGARTLRREIEKVKDIIADELLENEDKKELIVDFVEEKLIVK